MDRRNWLGELKLGDIYRIIHDYRTVEIQKLDGGKKYSIKESGIKYNTNGSYTAYDTNPKQVGEKGVLGYLIGARSIRGVKVK